MHQQDNSFQQNLTEPVCVELRVMFLQLGSISTQLTQFNAHVAIEARWIANESVLQTIDDDARQNLSEGHIVQLPDDFNEQKDNWHPQLFLLNSSIGKCEEQLRYSLKKDDEAQSGNIYVREHRIMKASFCSNFCLNYYPSDVQKLSISIGSALSGKKVKLVQHPTILSGINKEVFEAQDEWKLYDHVEAESRMVSGYFSLKTEDGDLDRPGCEKERSVLTFSCHVARRAGYFLWNGYCIIFLLTIIGFSSFAITANQTQQRLSVEYTLLLSQIAFRWTINVSHFLPPVSFLTILDKYSVLSIFTLIVLGAWHAIIGSLMFTYYYDQTIEPNTYWLWVDRYMFFSLLFLYILMHVGFLIYHYRGPWRYRQNMQRKEVKYRRQILGLDKLGNDLMSEV